MSLIYNDTNITAVNYNGTKITQVNYNGQKVWPSTRVLVGPGADPSSWSLRQSPAYATTGVTASNYTLRVSRGDIYWKTAAYCTVIDLTPYSLLTFTATYTPYSNGLYGGLACGVSASLPSSISWYTFGSPFFKYYDYGITQSPSGSTYSINISSLTGNHAIGIFAQTSNQDAADGYCTITLTSMILS